MLTFSSTPSVEGDAVLLPPTSASLPLAFLSTSFLLFQAAPANSEKVYF